MYVKIAPKETNMVGYYRECEESGCTRLVPCPHIMCQPHRKDMAIEDWSVESIEPSSDVNKST